MKNTILFICLFLLLSCTKTDPTETVPSEPFKTLKANITANTTGMTFCTSLPVAETSDWDVQFNFSNIKGREYDRFVYACTANNATLKSEAIDGTVGSSMQVYQSGGFFYNMLNIDCQTAQTGSVKILIFKTE